jgi:hypothetical protein
MTESRRKPLSCFRPIALPGASASLQQRTQCRQPAAGRHEDLEYRLFWGDPLDGLFERFDHIRRGVKLRRQAYQDQRVRVGICTSDFGSAIRCLPEFPTDFLPFLPDFPLCSRIETLISISPTPKGRPLISLKAV